MGSFSVLWIMSSLLYITYNTVDGGSDRATGAPKIASLDATCSATSIRVNVTFESAFDGIIYSKGAFYTPECIFVLPSSGEKEYSFEIPLTSCDTQQNKPNAEDEKNGLRSFENTIVIQSDPHFQDIFDIVRRIRCTTASQYEKIVDFLPINVNMREVVTATFTGDDVKVSLDVQNGRGPFAHSLNQGFIQIGDTVTLVIYMSAASGNWDLQVRECVAQDSKDRASLQLQDRSGCVNKPQIMTPFSLTHDSQRPDVLIAYAYLKAFRFPDDMQVQVKCVVAVCRDQCLRRSNCNGTNQMNNETGNDAGNREREVEVTTDGVRRIPANVKPIERNVAKPVTGRSQALPALTSNLKTRTKRQAREAPSGTLPLKRVFNVISPEDVANLFNSSVIISSELPANSLCINQAMFVVLMAFLFLMILSGAVALTVVCLRNRSLRNELSKCSTYVEPRY